MNFKSLWILFLLANVSWHLKAQSLSVPTDEIIDFPNLGPVFVERFETDSIQLWNTNGDVVLKTSVAKLRVNELRCLLESKLFYQRLSLVSSNKNETVWAKDTAKIIHDIWLSGTNLNNKIQTRLEILEAMRTYNGVAYINEDFLEYNKSTAARLRQTANEMAQKASVVAGNVANVHEEIAKDAEKALGYAETRSDVRRVMKASTEAAVYVDNLNQSVQQAAIKAQVAARSAISSIRHTRSVNEERAANTAEAYTYLGSLGIFPTNQEFVVFASIENDLDNERLTLNSLKN